MAINIQEILHPSDSDSIKFSKINYNFDQLVVNGGGPEGPKGDQGFKGETGNTGAVGPQGNKGDKGQSGETTSPWKSIAIDLDPGDNRDNLTILKPKPDTDKATPVIWIGDSSFFNVDSDSTAFDGDTSLRSSLNVGRHYNLSSGQVEAEYMTFWHNANKKLKIDSEDVGGTTTVRWNITPAQPIVGNPEDIRLHINTHTVLTEPFKLDNFAPVNSPVIEEPGMIRYNAAGNKFEGYISGQWKAFCMDSGAGCGSGGGGSISISGGNLNLNLDGTEVGSAPTFNFSNWNGSVSVDAAGQVSITNGNGINVTTDPASPVAANNTPGANALSFLVTVEVPSGYANAGSTVQDNVSVSQPTSYTAPTVNTYTLNISEGTTGVNNWSMTNAEIVVANSNGATQTSWTYDAPNNSGTMIFDAEDGTSVQLKIYAAAAAGREFVAGNDGAFTPYSGTSEVSDITSNATTAEYVFSFNTTGALSGGTWSITIEAATALELLTGTYNVNYGAGGQNGGEVCTGSGGTQSLSSLPVTLQSMSPTVQQWQNAAAFSAAQHLHNNSLLNQNFYFSVTSITDHNGNSIAPDSEYHEMDVGGSIGDSTACPAQTYTTTWNLTDNFTGAVLDDFNTGLSPVTQLVSSPSIQGTTQSDYLFIVREAGYAAFTNTNEVTVTVSGGTVSGAMLDPNNGNWIRVTLADTNQGQNATINVNVTGSLSSEQFTFTWLTPGTNSAQNYMDWETSSGDNVQEFTWQDINSGVQGPALTGGSAAASDFNWYNWNELDSSLTSVYVSDTYNGAQNGNTPHTGGSGWAKFFFVNDGTETAGQQNGSNNGTEVIFDGNAWGGIPAPGSTTGMWVVLTAYCHLAGTVMHLADGTTKLVEDLEVGDILKSYSITGLGTDENEQPPSSYTASAEGWAAVESTTTVTFVNEGTYNKYFNFNNGLTKVTSGHPVLTKDANDNISFKKAEDVVNGDSFYINGAWTEVTNIELVTPEEDFATYTIGVEDDDIYVADGIVWHNVPGK